MTTRFAESVCSNMEFLTVDGCWSSVSVLHIAMQGRPFMWILGVVLWIGYSFGWWEDEGEEPPLRSFECAKGSNSPLSFTVVEIADAEENTCWLAGTSQSRNPVHSVHWDYECELRTPVGGGRDVYVDLSMCYSDRRESWSSCPSSPLGTSLSRLKQFAPSPSWSISRLSRGTLCLSGTVIF